MPTQTRKPRDIADLRSLRDRLLEDVARGGLSLGEAVKRMREVSGLTQEQFARHRGMSSLTLKNIENGKANPTVATLDKIGGVFGLRVGYVRSRPAEHGRPDSGG